MPSGDLTGRYRLRGVRRQAQVVKVYLEDVSECLEETISEAQKLEGEEALIEDIHELKTLTDKLITLIGDAFLGDPS